MRLLFHKLLERVRRGVRLKLDVQGQGGGAILDVVGQEGMGGLQNQPIFMDVICVSSLIWYNALICLHSHREIITSKKN